MIKLNFISQEVAGSRNIQDLNLIYELSLFRLLSFGYIISVGEVGSDQGGGGGSVADHIY